MLHKATFGELLPNGFSTYLGLNKELQEMYRRMRRTYLYRGVLALIILMFFRGHAFSQVTSNAERPNVLLILTDDQGWGDIGYHGHPYLETPHLDKFAAESLELTQFTTFPSCSPTRAGLLTGRYCYRTGVTEVLGGNYMMHGDEVTIAEILSEAGYETGIFGKWHLGSNYPMRPTDQGFGEALVHKGGGIGQPAGPPANSYFDPILEHNDVSKRYEGYCDDIFTDAAIEFMRNNQDGPFFAYLATNLPHFPLHVADELADPYRKKGLHELNALTYGMIASIDNNVGRVLAAIDEMGIREETIVIFMSDNGPRTRRTKNDKYPDRYVAGLRGTKTSVYDNGIRVPFFIRWPGVLEAGKKIDTNVGHLDVFPTLLDACGVKTPESEVIDGWSLMPLLRGDAVEWPSRNLFYQLHAGPEPFRYVHFAVRSDRYKLVGGQDDPHTIYDPPSRVEVKRILEKLELYDIRNDPSEIYNIAAEYPEIVDQMLADYEIWFDEVTSERDLQYQERAVLGTENQKKVIFSRFDNRQWRLAKGGKDWDAMLVKQGGHWDIETAKSNRYRVRVLFEPRMQDGIVHLRYLGERYEKMFRSGDESVEFENLELPQGQGQLRVYLKTERYPEDVAYVNFEDLNS